MVNRRMQWKRSSAVECTDAMFGELLPGLKHALSALRHPLKRPFRKLIFKKP